MRNSLLATIFILGIVSCDQTSKQKHKTSHKDSLKNIETSNFETSVLFVQWQYPNSVSDFKVLDIRQSLEKEIGQTLQSMNLGHWIMGDLGPGGANMLFEVTDSDKALLVIREILKEENIDKETVIAIAHDSALRGDKPSNFTVIYPKDYKGSFNDE